MNATIPKTIVTATRLLWLVVFFGLISYLFEYKKPGHGLIGSPITLTISSVFLILSIGFINHYLLKAKNWARWLILSLVLMSLPAFALPEIQSSPVTFLYTTISTILEISASYLVYSSSSNSWFK